MQFGDNPNQSEILTILQEHSQILQEHSQILQQHSEQLQEQSEQLRKLTEETHATNQNIDRITDRVETYQKSSQQVVNLAFGLIVAATASIIVPAVMGR